MWNCFGMKLNNFQLLRNVTIARLARKLSNFLTFDGNGQAQVEDSQTFCLEKVCANSSDEWKNRRIVVMCTMGVCKGSLPSNVLHKLANPRNIPWNRSLRFRLVSVSLFYRISQGTSSLLGYRFQNRALLKANFCQVCLWTKIEKIDGNLERCLLSLVYVSSSSMSKL